MVRASLGAYNTFEEIDALTEMLERIARDDYQGRYCQAAGTGEYCAAGVDEQASASYAALMRPRLSEMQLRSSAQ